MKQVPTFKRASLSHRKNSVSELNILQQNIKSVPCFECWHNLAAFECNADAANETKSATKRLLLGFSLGKVSGFRLILSAMCSSISPDALIWPMTICIQWDIDHRPNKQLIFVKEVIFGSYTCLLIRSQCTWTSSKVRLVILRDWNPSLQCFKPAICCQI